MSTFLQSVPDQLFRYYDLGGYYDEMFAAPREPRPHYRRIFSELAGLPSGVFDERRQLADVSLLLQGQAAATCPESRVAARPLPIDLVPRILPAAEWAKIERGLTQRVVALNCFLSDIYGPRRILQEGRLPGHLVASCRQFRPEVVGVPVPRGAYAHISGIDLIRDSHSGDFLVLEDNLRSPNGIASVIENRAVMAHIFPDAFRGCDVLPVDQYPVELGKVLRSLAPPTASDPVVVLLSPGIHNHAYSEHTFLAQQMGVELVEGRDLLVDDSVVYMKTTTGLTRVDVIYRRLDDEFLDSLAFRADSLLGVPGLVGACRVGTVAIANAIGAALAADKAIYSFVPEFIRYYLGEEPVLSNVETWCCADPSHLAFVLEHLDQLVVKAVAETGGHGMLMGPAASRHTLAEFRDRIKADARNYVAQPVIPLSRCPAYDARTGAMAGRHVDLRPYCLFDGDKVTIVPGGLTRFAFKPGSLVVTSAPGGGSKDTWVLRGES